MKYVYLIQQHARNAYTDARRAYDRHVSIRRYEPLNTRLQAHTLNEAVAAQVTAAALSKADRQTRGVE